MMLMSDVRNYLQSQFPNDKFYNGTIDKNEQKCVGVYARGNTPPILALGGLENTTYARLPVFILVHWTPNANTCQVKANEIYMSMFGKSGVVIGGKRVIDFQMLDATPVDIQRDENNICEMVIRCNILYER